MCVCVCVLGKVEVGGLILLNSSEHENSGSGDDAVAKVTHMAARRSVYTSLQQYFIKQCFRDAHHTALDMCMDRVFTKAACEMKQTTLDSFVAYM